MEEVEVRLRNRCSSRLIAPIASLDPRSTYNPPECLSPPGVTASPLLRQLDRSNTGGEPRDDGQPNPNDRARQDGQGEIIIVP